MKIISENSQRCERLESLESIGGDPRDVVVADIAAKANNQVIEATIHSVGYCYPHTHILLSLL